MSLFPRVVCLATPVEDPARFARASAELPQILGQPVSFVSGLHQRTSGLITTHPYMVDRVIGTDESYSIGPHPVNIWIGHYMIWNALLLSDDAHWLVLECDAQFTPDWRDRYQDALLYLPLDWDLLYLGSCCTRGRQQDPLGGGLFRMHGTAPQCNHAYLVTRDAARIMVQTLRKVWAPIDIQQASECWGDPLRNAVDLVAPPERVLNVYTILPRVVHQYGTDLAE